MNRRLKGFLFAHPLIFEMSTLQFAALALHVLAAVSWIGGMIFISVVLMPIVNDPWTGAEIVTFFRHAARRFRVLVWGSIVVLLGSGPVLLEARGLSLLDPVGWPMILTVKLSLVLLLVVLTFLHDGLSGSRIKPLALVPEAERTVCQRLLLRSASWIPRLAFLVSLIVLMVGLLLSRT